MLALHTAAGIASLLTGAVVAARTKGTALHRTIGRIYAVSMLTLCLSSLVISADLVPFFTVGGITYGIFHVFAVWGTLQLIAGLVPMIWRSRFADPLMWHLYNMQWSFVGLIMATNSHFFRYVAPWIGQTLELSMGWTLGVTGVLLWGVPCIVGTVVIERSKTAHRAKREAVAAAA
jgi:uncharacterized membrane protein